MLFQRCLMPRRKDAARLEELAMGAVGLLVTQLGVRLVEPVCACGDSQQAMRTLCAGVERINALLRSSVPVCVYDRVAITVLCAVKELIDRTKRTYDQRAPIAHFISEMNVVVSLTESVINSSLKSIDFTMWPKIMRYVLYKNVNRMVSLEVLNLSSCAGSWQMNDFDVFITNGLAQMRNLHSLCLCFDCTDAIVAVLGSSCPCLQFLDVMSSRSVTDRSIPSLLKCRELKELLLHHTSVSVEGFSQLLVGLPSLQNLGRCDEFGDILSYLQIHHPYTGPFQLRKFQSRYVTSTTLKLLSLFCPKIESITMFHEDLCDLIILTYFDSLTELKLLSCKFYDHYVKQLLEIKGCNLLSLHLEHVEEIDLDAVIHINKFCPRLRNLVFYNCELSDHVSPEYRFQKVTPFQYLERIFCVTDSARVHLDYLLTHCFNIKFIHLGSSTGIDHALVYKVLGFNPMTHLEELRILYGSDLSLLTVQLLLASCPKLRVLSELESWQGISEEELKQFKQFIRVNNYELDIRPTLSY